MAASNSDEDENYWPGYVDALTTMTMVLTFIMMVLGVMVFVLSQDSVSSKMGTVARALKIESRELERLSQAEIEDALRRSAGRLERGAGPNKGEQSGEQAAGGPSGSPADGMENTGVVSAPGLGPVGLPRSMGGRPGPEGSQNESSNKFTSTFSGGLQGDQLAGPGGEYLITNQEPTGVAGQERGTGSRIEPGPGALRFVFENGAIDMPPAVAEALQAYVAAEGSGPMIIEAVAVANAGGPTDARRKAYFRAMLIRSRLIKLGIDPVRIAVRVRDATQITALETVDLMKQRKGG